MDLYKNKTRLYVIINWISHEDNLLHFLQKVLLHKQAIVVKVLARLDQYDQRDNHDKWQQVASHYLQLPGSWSNLHGNFGNQSAKTIIYYMIDYSPDQRNN